MSGIFRSSSSVLVGTPLDPAGPGGGLVDLATETTGTLPAGSLPAGTTDRHLLLRYTVIAAAAIPPGGVQFLDLAGSIASSTLGEILTAGATLVGIAASVNVADATNDYDIEVVSDPAGVPAVLGSLALAATNSTAKRRDLAVAVAADTLIGVRVSRTAGAGSSDFGEISVLVEVKIP